MVGSGLIRPVLPLRRVAARNRQDYAGGALRRQASADEGHSRAEHVCGHWAIENRLRWRLDASLVDDRMRLRTGYAGKSLHVPQQMSLYLTCICYGEIRARAGRKVFYRAKPAQKIQTRDPNTRGDSVKNQANASAGNDLCRAVLLGDSFMRLNW